MGGNDLRAMHEHEYHEEQLAKKTKLRRNKSVRRTSVRVEERKKLKASSQLRQLPTFGQMNSETFQKVVDPFVYMEFPHDAIILLQGKPSDKFCVLVKGVVEISVNRKDNIENNVDDNENNLNSSSTIVGRKSAPWNFGESALVPGEVRPERTATVRAVGPVRLLALRY